MDRVIQTVNSVKPDVVAVELDRERYYQLTEAKAGKNATPQKMAEDAVQGLMQNLAILEQRLGETTGSSVGEEMIAAIEEGRRIGAKIALVDRPLHLTVQALMSVPLDEIYRLTGLVPEANEEIVQGDSKDIFGILKEEGAIADLMKDFENEFPLTAEALIHQRDRYVANALVTILDDVEGRIVVVLGAGHINGVQKVLKELLEKQSAS